MTQEMEGHAFFSCQDGGKGRFFLLERRGLLKVVHFVESWSVLDFGCAPTPIYVGADAK